MKEVKVMKEIWNWVQVALTALGGFLGWFLGGFDGFLYALVTLKIGRASCKEIV